MLSDFERGQKHYREAKSITDMQSFTAEFLNGYMFEERQYLIERSYEKGDK